MSQFDIKELANIRTSGVGSVATILMVIVSVGLNLVLMTKLFRQNPSLPPPPSQSGSNNIGSSVKALPLRSATNAAVASLTTNAPPFHWSEIESTDYRQYIANLRAVGCPEQVIRDIIVADVNQLFASRIQAIWQPRNKAYWQKYGGDPPSPEQLKQLTAIEKEKSGVVQELLGFKPSQQGLTDTLHLQLHGSEQQLLFLSPEKREAALKALADGDFETKEMELYNRNRYSPGDEKKLFDEKTKLLAGVLTPEEREEFKLRNSQMAQTLRTELEYFDCTVEEFKQLYAAREQEVDGKNSRFDLLNRMAATEEVRKLFGDERAKEFERVTDVFYMNTRRSAEEQGIPLETIEAAWRVTRDVRTAADAAEKNSALSVDERKQQVQALRQQAEAKLIELLGDKASRAVRRDLGVVIGANEARIGR